MAPGTGYIHVKMDLLRQTNHMLGKKQFAEAEPILKQAYNSDPTNPEIYRQLAITYLETGRCEEALPLLNGAIALEPWFGPHYTSLGCALIGYGLYDEAIATLKRALELAPRQPMAEWNIALAYLAKGDWKLGWEHYSKGVYSGSRPFRCPEPKFERGKHKSVLIWCEQGLGDCVMFSGLLSEFAYQNPKVTITLETNQELYRLFESNFGSFARVVTRPTDSHLPYVFESQLSIGDLPGMLGFQSCDHLTKFLAADEELTMAFKELLPKDKPVGGIAWQGNTSHANDCNRSLPLEQLQNFLLPEVSWIGLQKELPYEVETIPNLGAITGSLIDAYSTAALIMALDFVVTVDSFIAHLAGALGKRVYMLTPSVPEWRWLEANVPCVWYEDLHYIKQGRPQDWENWLINLQAALEKEHGISKS